MIMFSKERYNDIFNEVKNSIELALDIIKTNSFNNYILLLAYGEYQELLLRRVELSPYSIDYTYDRYIDENRLKFLVDFMNTYYSFNESVYITPDRYRINLELMVYTHVWESKPFLKTLYRFAHIVTGEEYPWKIEVPDMSKHEFIRNDIRAIFEISQCSFSDVIKKGYHSSLRNAFAHSEYYFNIDTGDDRIHLNNYNGSHWELKDISFDDWTNRFVYSVYLSFHLYDCIRRRRLDLSNEFESLVFQIKRPSRNGGSNYNVPIEYNKEDGLFRFK